MILIAMFIFLLVSFTFSGIEAGILSVNRVRLRHRVKIGDKAAIKLERLLAKRERILVTVLLVTNLMNIFAIVLSTRLTVHWLGGAGYFVAAIIWLLVYLLGLELFPKIFVPAFSLRFPRRVCRIAARDGPDPFAAVVDWRPHPSYFCRRKRGGGRRIIFRREGF